MKVRDLVEGVGRITKQNQTVDVGPDEIKKQAAKFGNTVDRDGRPPTLSKKVKGKSTNVLYNLGLTESRIQQLEASYEGNIGIMELMKFFQTAPKDLVAQVKELINQKRDKEVWRIVQKYTGTKLKGKEFESEEIVDEDITRVTFNDGSKKFLRTYGKVSNDEIINYYKKKGLTVACIGKDCDLDEKWSKKYKDSINCSNPKGFSQKAHCAGRKKK
jgi:hypothetical protein